MEKNIQFIQTSPEQLQIEIVKKVKEHLSDFLENYKPQTPNDYLTRKELAEMLKVDISTVHNWCKSGKLKPLGIGNRVYFLRKDVESSIIPLNSSF